MNTSSGRILIVDDELRNIRLLDSMLKPEGHELEHARSGEEALAAAEKWRPDLILLDVMMPGMDGFAVAGKLKLDPATRHIPIIMVTSLDDRASRLAALNMGAEEFVTKPVDRAELWVRVRNLMRLKKANDLLAENARLLEQRVEERSRELTSAHRATIAALSRASAYRDEETGTHVRRISQYCVELAQAIGMDSAFCECIGVSSPMHDLGKIAIPDRVLLKTGPLDPAEWAVMKTHSALGEQMLAGDDSPYLRMGREIARGHHERWDGTGYPDGSIGEQTPLSARIMALADVYDALRSARPYKAAIDHDDAVRTILQGDGRTARGHFDPMLLSIFERRLERFAEIFETFSDDVVQIRLCAD